MLPFAVSAAHVQNDKGTEKPHPSWRATPTPGVPASASGPVLQPPRLTRTRQPPGRARARPPVHESEATVQQCTPARGRSPPRQRLHRPGRAGSTASSRHPGPCGGGRVSSVVAEQGAAAASPPTHFCCVLRPRLSTTVLRLNLASLNTAEKRWSISTRAVAWAPSSSHCQVSVCGAAGVPPAPLACSTPAPCC